MMTLFLAFTLQAEPAESLQRKVAELERRLHEQQRLIDDLLRKVPADDPLHETLALAADPCAQNLKKLWQLQMNYASTFGGRMKMMPKETGRDFWLALTKTDPPLLPADQLGLLVCPMTREQPKAGYTSYRGPSGPIGRIAGGDPVGCCEPETHRDGSIVVLFKSGDVRRVRPGAPLHAKALEATTGDPARQARRILLMPIAGLKQLATAEADFRANDRDGNRVQDFWVGDVSGLLRVLIPPGQPIRLISPELAASDVAPLASDRLAKHDAPVPTPFGGYLFVTLKGYREEGAVKAYHSGDHRSVSRFGFAAYPSAYKPGDPTYLINEGNTVFARDTAGKTPDAFPSDDDLLKEWKKVD